MTVWFIPSCPEDSCTVDVTPRHCKRFEAKRGERFRWTNTSVADGKEIQSGRVTADEWGRATLRRVTVMKGRNRLTLRRQ